MPSSSPSQAPVRSIFAGSNFRARLVQNAATAALADGAVEAAADLAADGVGAGVPGAAVGVADEVLLPQAASMRQTAMAETRCSRVMG